MTTVAITGAAGRMGRRIAAIATESQQFTIVAAVEGAGHEALGADVGELAGVGKLGVAVTQGLGSARADAVIDFSLPEGTMAILPVCRQRKIAMVLGTTGLTPSQQAEVADAASEIAIVQAANYSVGVNVLLRAVADVARTLGEDYDVEIVEAHHRFKKDAPSGTAIALARSVCAARGWQYEQVAQDGRTGIDPRKKVQIGMHAVRLGDTVGEHAVSFGGLGETVTISHSAHTRDTFVRGALRAAKWLVGQKPGLYTMQQVLGLA